MAKKPQTVTANPYLAQLQAIKASLQGGLYMTQDEGAAIVAAGLAQVDTSNVQDDKAFVTLTVAGMNMVGTGPADAPKPAKEKPVFTISSAVPVPTKTRKTKEAIYPIDALEVGQSFHVAKTDENPDPASRLQSTAVNYRTKYMVEVKDENGNTVMETVTRKTYERDAEGKIVVGADGHRVVTGSEQVSQPKMETGRDFVVAAVDASDPEGVGARIWRTK